MNYYLPFIALVIAEPARYTFLVFYVEVVITSFVETTLLHVRYVISIVNTTKVGTVGKYIKFCQTSIIGNSKYAAKTARSRGISNCCIKLHVLLNHNQRRNLIHPVSGSVAHPPISQPREETSFSVSRRIII